MPDILLRTNKNIAEIYERHVDTVYKVCFMFMKNVPDTEDAVQNTFIKLIKERKKFENEEHEKAWLIVTASNLCRNTLKHWWRKNVDIASVVETEALQNNKTDETLEHVLNLPEKYKTVIYLYYYEGYSSGEIAKILKRNESTVRSHLRTGRQLLRDRLGGDFNEE